MHNLLADCDLLVFLCSKWRKTSGDDSDEDQMLTNIRSRLGGNSLYGQTIKDLVSNQRLGIEPREEKCQDALLAHLREGAAKDRKYSQLQATLIVHKRQYSTIVEALESSKKKMKRNGQTCPEIQKALEYKLYAKADKPGSKRKEP